MKKLLLIALLIGMMGSCTELKNRPNGLPIGYEVVVMDGCEYINETYSNRITHKGNCSNPIHKGGNK